MSFYMRYRASVDGLWALAVLSVVFFHASPAWVPGGYTGVDVFFVISGYLISKILMGNLSRGSFDFVEFYARRASRIFPALVITLAAVSFLGWWGMLPDEYTRLGKHVVGGATFVSNFILAREGGYFDVESGSKPLLHLWSLGIEE